MRRRLTLLYALAFLLSGVVLLIFPLSQVGETTPVGSGRPPAPVAPEWANRVLVFSVGGLVLLALVSIPLGWWIAGRFLRPLRTITATARDISATNLHRRLPPTRRADEFAELSATLNDLFARLEAAFESQRHFVANASHELRTPLTAERALLQVALADPQATVQSLRSTCHEVLALGEGQERLIDALLTLAASEQAPPRTEPLDLADVVAGVLEERRAQAQRYAVHVEAALAPAPAVGDPDLLASLVANVIDNAVRHNLASGGQVQVATGADAARAWLHVRNTGPVVPAEILGQLFQPFQRVGRIRPGEGHGLGLAIVRAIADAHGAHLGAQARPDGGLDLEVVLHRG
jgi:signal transduction histidine kinase